MTRVAQEGDETVTELRRAPQSQTLDRGLRILEVLADSTMPLSTAALAAALDVHRSVVYRMLRTLEDHRLVRRRTDGAYELGLGLPSLARAVYPTLQAAALPELSAVAEDLGMTAFVAVRESDEAVTLASVEPRHSGAHVAYRPGVRHPVDRGAPGIALLAGEPPTAHERRAVTEARRLGFATSRSEVLPGMSSVAVALVSPTTGVLGAVAVVFAGGGSDKRRIADRLTGAARAMLDNLP